MTRTTLRRWMPVALMLSLAVNFFFAGLAVSHVGRPPPPPHGPPGPEGFLQRLAETLPPDDAVILRRALDANRATMQAEHDVRESFPQRIRAALLAEPFDPKALLAVFETTDQQERALRQRVQASLAEAAAAMSPEGRRRMAEFRPPRHGPPGPPPGPGFR
ncbi:periplasmic heavy metal sensor [Azospirillum sp. TSO22-1]|uniref:periplasmic heavy metal sensor n=1 Tax=Azospirillum sp. TSO22-1 TaxID=716789 RepID=UPI000D61A2C8|nr:periplasmic heavy metal sensor [Azospirillum sp. TSO22-1]PWC32065.1 hypothetical protein TSO221_31625 [Azospirillum sp. TSO22-1]